MNLSSQLTRMQRELQRAVPSAEFSLGVTENGAATLEVSTGTHHVSIEDNEVFSLFDVSDDSGKETAMLDRDALALAIRVLERGERVVPTKVPQMCVTDLVLAGTHFAGDFEEARGSAVKIKRLRDDRDRLKGVVTECNEALSDLPPGSTEYASVKRRLDKAKLAVRNHTLALQSLLNGA